MVRPFSRGDRSREVERERGDASRARLERPERAPRPREGAIAAARSRVRLSGASESERRERAGLEWTRARERMKE